PGANGALIVTGTIGAINAALDGLRFTPVANFNGPVTLTITTDDRGNFGAGVSQPNTKTVAITVTAVNDAPSFTRGGDQTVLEDQGAQTVVGWATNISAGPPDEAGQTLNFLITTSNDSLFSALPTIDPATGTLRYTTA